MRLPKQLTTCKHCRREFRVKASTLSRGGGKYCGKACEIASRHGRNIPLATRFWKHVEKTESCWLWTASKNPNGYGQIRHGDRPVLAHRVSWEIHNGPIPDGVEVCHNCPGGDNPACVNPSHLFLGDHADNMQDSVQKGRTNRGERATYSKLTEIQVAEMRRRYAIGDISQSELANEYGISQSTVTEIIRGVIWSHSFTPQDAPTKRRRAHGERTGGSKLTEASVIQIRARAAAGVSQAKLAKEYGVSNRNINNIVRGTVWKHLL